MTLKDKKTEKRDANFYAYTNTIKMFNDLNLF